MSTKLEQGAVLRLLRGESIELVSRELSVTAAELSAWRDAFLAAGEASLKTRSADDRDAEIARLKGKLGDLTMANELLEAKIEAGARPPFGPTEGVSGIPCGRHDRERKETLACHDAKRP